MQCHKKVFTIWKKTLLLNASTWQFPSHFFSLHRRRHQGWHLLSVHLNAGATPPPPRKVPQGERALLNEHARPHGLKGLTLLIFSVAFDTLTNFLVLGIPFLETLATSWDHPFSILLSLLQCSSSLPWNLDVLCASLTHYGFDALNHTHLEVWKHWEKKAYGRPWVCSGIQWEAGFPGFPAPAQHELGCVSFSDSPSTFKAGAAHCMYWTMFRKNKACLVWEDCRFGQRAGFKEA